MQLQTTMNTTTCHVFKCCKFSIAVSNSSYYQIDNSTSTKTIIGLLSFSPSLLPPSLNLAAAPSHMRLSGFQTWQPRKNYFSIFQYRPIGRFTGNCTRGFVTWNWNVYSIEVDYEAPFESFGAVNYMLLPLL